MSLLVPFVLALLGAGTSQEPVPPSPDPADVLEALLAGLGDFGEASPDALRREVVEIGQVPFRHPVEFEYLEAPALRCYLEGLVAEEYPVEQAAADASVLAAFDLLDEEVDLRGLRLRLLEENVVGFYDPRPGQKRLCVVSGHPRLTPANQLVLVHELRHALQDQYVDVYGALPESISDFDDRQLAFLAMLEGDATLVMEHFLVRRLPPDRRTIPERRAGQALPEVPGAPPVLRDQLVVPYVAGRDFAAAVWRRLGWAGLRDTWRRPPVSSEQVLHPEKYLAAELPLDVPPPPGPGRIVAEGVLGEALIRSWLGDSGWEAAAGWGGDRYVLRDLEGRRGLAWRSRWDSEADRREFLDALTARFEARRGSVVQRGDWWVCGAGSRRWAWRSAPGEVWFVAADGDGALQEAVAAFDAP